MCAGGHRVPPLQKIMQSLKSTTTREYWKYEKQNKLWQRTYYEHIIRNEKEYLEIYKYIEENPIKWKYDKYNTERVEKIMKENEEVKKAKSVLHVMSKDEELKRLAELKEKWERDEKSAQVAWKEEGLEEGIEKGRREEKVSIAKNMKKNKFTTEQIAQITGLSKEEIEEIQEDN